MADGQGNLTTDSRTIQPIHAVILGLIATPGILANAFAFILTTRILRHQKINCNVFVLGLSFCDLLGIILICVPTWTCYGFGKWVGGDLLRDFQGFSTTLLPLASGMLATCMSVDRYIALRAPFFHRQHISFRFAKKLLIAVITLSALVSMMPVFGCGSFYLNSTYSTLNWFATSKNDKIYAYVFVSIGFLLILTVIGTNTHVLLSILKRKKSARNLKGLRSQFKKVNETKKTASEKVQQQYQRMMVIICILFLICWSPFVVRIICNVSGVWRDASADGVAAYLLVLKATLDPFVYVLTRKQYGKTFLRYCCCCFPGIKKRSKESIKIRFAYSASLKNPETNPETDHSQLNTQAALKPREERASFQRNTPLPDVSSPVFIQSTDALVHASGESPGGTNTITSSEKVNGELKVTELDSDKPKSDEPELVTLETPSHDNTQTLRDKQGILPTITEEDVREALRDLAREPGFANEGMTDDADLANFNEIMETLKKCFAGQRITNIPTRKLTSEAAIATEGSDITNDNDLLILIGGEKIPHDQAIAKTDPTVSMKALHVMDIIQTKRRAKQIEKMV